MVGGQVEGVDGADARSSLTGSGASHGRYRRRTLPARPVRILSELQARATGASRRRRDHERYGRAIPRSRLIRARPRPARHQLSAGGRDFPLLRPCRPLTCAVTLTFSVGPAGPVCAGTGTPAPHARRAGVRAAAALDLSTARFGSAAGEVRRSAPMGHVLGPVVWKRSPTPPRRQLMTGDDAAISGRPCHPFAAKT